MRIGNREFKEKGKTYICGILNVTPDSFSDGGKYTQMTKALLRVEQMIKEGMDILDIGGESTRPGYQLLTDEEEIYRVIPVIEEIKKQFSIPISLDTYKSRVAREGINAGVDLINDIWGLKYERDEHEITKMGKLIAESGIPCCIMHNRKNTEYNSFMQDVAADLSESLYLAEKAGIDERKIILDPGVGFAKTYEQNLEIMNHLDELAVLGCPILLGCSRKSVIGLTLSLDTRERLEGTIATSVIGVMKGCSFLRVHDIKENVRAVKMAEAILYSR